MPAQTRRAAAEGAWSEGSPTTAQEEDLGRPRPVVRHFNPNAQNQTSPTAVTSPTGRGRRGASPATPPAVPAGDTPTTTGRTERSPTPPPAPSGPSSLTRSYFTEIPWTLHTQPTTYVTLAAMAVTMIATYIINHHVLGTKDHVGLFLVGSYVIFSSYFLVYYFLDMYSSSFQKVSSDKKFYTISNLIKAGVLAAITPFITVELYYVVMFDVWRDQYLQNLGCIYAIPDFVSLILVRRMSYTTIVHHLCVIVFNYFSVYNDYQQENVVRLIAVYAAFSTFAYCVNMLLASRFLGVSTSAVRVLSVAALLVYVGCCAVNWAWQVAYLHRLVGGPHDHWTIYVYMMLISFVMWDDIVLMRWLLQNVRSKSKVGSGTLKQKKK